MQQPALLTLQVVLGLAHIHPVARQREGKQLVVCCYVGEHLALYAGGAQLDAVKDRGVDNVDACVDLVPNKLLLSVRPSPRRAAGRTACISSSSNKGSTSQKGRQLLTRGQGGACMMQGTTRPLLE